MEYFKHDINASEDDKICELLANEGYELLGYYWRFVEYLYSRNGKVERSKLKSVAWSLHMELAKLDKLINEYGLFYEENGYIYSKRVVAEISEFEAVGKRMAEIGKAGGKASAKAKAKADGEACGKHTLDHTVNDSSSTRLAYAQQNKKNKEKKENKEKGFALTGISPNGVEYFEKNGKRYNAEGKEINEQGYEIIDFGLSKSKVPF